MEIKPLRYLDIKPIGDDLFVVSDPLCITDDFVVNRFTLMIMFFLDGKKTVEELRREIISRTGIFLPQEQLEQLLDFFNKNGLFYDDKVFEIKNSKIEDLKRKGYIDSYNGLPSDPKELVSFLKLDKIDRSNGRFRAAIIPHLDLRVALEAYHKAYQELNKSDYERVFIFGVSHFFHNGLFSVCPLDFQTPFGLVRTDKEVVINISENFGIDIFENTLNYVREHSIAFHLPFIKYLYNNPKVVAVLVFGGEDEVVLKNRLGDLADFIVSNYPDSIFISSIDLSHVGYKFGDEILFDPKEIDDQYIKFLASVNPDEAFNYLKNIGNKTKIDGLFTNYLFLKIVDKLELRKSRVLEYNKYFEKETNSVVSYCSIVYSL